MNTLNGELYTYNNYIEPILKQIDPNMYNWDDPNFIVYTMNGVNYNKHGKVIE